MSDPQKTPSSDGFSEQAVDFDSGATADDEFSEEALEKFLAEDMEPEHSAPSPLTGEAAIAPNSTPQMGLPNLTVTQDFEYDPSDYSDEAFSVVKSMDDTFGPDQAKRAKGNYLLTFGYAASGKSTFHSMLFRYIEHSGLYKFGLRPPAGSKEPSQAMMRRMQAWRSSWTQRSFVDATPAGLSDIHEIAYAVEPLKGVKNRLEFSIIEVSGELLKSVDGLSIADKEISLPEALNELLANPSVNLIIVIMIDPENAANDLMFSSLMPYIDQNFPGRLSRIPVCALIAKPEKALNTLKAHPEGAAFRGQPDFTRESRNAYLRQFAPGVFAHLSTTKPELRMLMPLRLGKYAQRTNPNTGQSEDYLQQPNFRDIQDIFAWIYQQFTKKKLGKTKWQQFVSELSRPVARR